MIMATIINLVSIATQEPIIIKDQDIYYIFENDNTIVINNCKFAYQFNEHFAAIAISRKNGIFNSLFGQHDKQLWGFVDKKGNYLIEPIFSDAQNFSEGFAAIRKFKNDNFSIIGQYGYIDYTGNIVIEEKFDDALSFSEKLAAVKSKGRWGYIDRNGKWVIDPKFIDAKSFNEGISAVQRDANNWVLIDKSGSAINKKTFRLLGNYSCKLAPAIGNESKNIGYINMEGDFVLEPKYITATSFKYGHAIVSFMEDTGLVTQMIDVNGSPVTEKFDIMCYLNGFLMVGSKKNKNTFFSGNTDLFYYIYDNGLLKENCLNQFKLNNYDLITFYSNYQLRTGDLIDNFLIRN